MDNYFTFDKCALCDSAPIEYSNHDQADIWQYQCARCGKVKVKSDDLSFIRNKYHDRLWLLSAFCRRSTKLGAPALAIHQGNVKEIIENQNVPHTLRDAKEKLLEYLGDKSDLKGSLAYLNSFAYLDVLLPSSTELNYVAKCLFEEGNIDLKRPGPGRIITIPSELDHWIDFHSKDFSITDNQLRLSPKGRELYDQLQRNKNGSSHQVFIAMWYDPKTAKLRDSLVAGVRAAGYYPIIADIADYTGLVMDFVLASIRESKFVIADFSVDPEKSEVYQSGTETSKQIVKAGVRGGVYYEAGFAKGLGLEVIHTCKDDDASKARLHFDIKQMQTIYWNDPELQDTSVRKVGERESQSIPKNFAERIHDRIVNIFGYGPGLRSEQIDATIRN